MGCHFLLQGIFPGTEAMSLESPALADGFFTTAAAGKPKITLPTCNGTNYYGKQIAKGKKLQVDSSMLCELKLTKCASWDIYDNCHF